MEADKTILQMKYARIVSIFAKQTGKSIDDALDFFYDSYVYRMMCEGIADMHCRSDGYLADLLKEEWEKKDEKIVGYRCKGSLGTRRIHREQTQ